MEQSNVLRLLSHHQGLSITEITEKQGVNKAKSKSTYQETNR